jgi:hypothetical protein
MMQRLRQKLIRTTTMLDVLAQPMMQRLAEAKTQFSADD